MNYTEMLYEDLFYVSLLRLSIKEAMKYSYALGSRFRENNKRNKNN